VLQDGAGGAERSSTYLCPTASQPPTDAPSSRYRHCHLDHRRAMLMSDMPSPNNGHIIWHTYTDSNRGGRHGAMVEMLGPGRMLKVRR
jgi:hypothetical protein